MYRIRVLSARGNGTFHSWAQNIENERRAVSYDASVLVDRDSDKYEDALRSRLSIPLLELESEKVPLMDGHRRIPENEHEITGRLTHFSCQQCGKL